MECAIRSEGFRQHVVVYLDFVVDGFLNTIILYVHNAPFVVGFIESPFVNDGRDVSVLARNDSLVCLSAKYACHSVHHDVYVRSGWIWKIVECKISRAAVFVHDVSLFYVPRLDDSTVNVVYSVLAVLFYPSHIVSADIIEFAYVGIFERNDNLVIAVYHTFLSIIGSTHRSIF